MEARHLKNKIISSGFWAALSFSANKIFQLITSIIVARILAPEDYGMNGIIWAVILIMERFTQMGMQPAAIQKTDYDINDMGHVLDTLFITNVIRGIFLSFLMVISGRWVALFYDKPQLEAMIQFSSLYFLVNSFVNVGQTIRIKNIDFKKVEIWQQIASTLQLFILIGLTIKMRNVWALVYASVIGAALFTVSTYFVSPYRPRLHFNKEVYFDLLSFGKYFILTEILILLASRLDAIIIGKVRGMVELGFYVLAYRVVCLNMIQITNLINKITFPAFATIQNNTDMVLKVFARSLKYFLATVLPGLAFLFVFTSDIVFLCYGNKWMPIVPVLKIIIFVAAFKSLENLFKSIFQGTGHVQPFFKINLLCTVVFSICIYPVTKLFGIIGVSYLLLAVTFLFHIVSWPLFLKLFKTGFLPVVSQLFPSVLATMIMSIFLYLMKYYSILSLPSLMFAIVLNLLIGLFIYLSSFFCIRKIKIFTSHA
jgi:O-antigen/teichoic acid export membrane protein